MCVFIYSQFDNHEYKGNGKRMKVVAVGTVKGIENEK